MTRRRMMRNYKKSLIGEEFNPSEKREHMQPYLHV